ncbi:Voltage-gated potassium channel subunit beta-1 [Myotis davidii]|uniref:Voltage-gated potassium channel subunit beta-1 n=1 Tax=Myotis davidii TaxID=225400 RepID=L5MGD8_MYODS|nr:Voltage-gated potassium channel subunit beta-1 [Myotis davidii]
MQVSIACTEHNLKSRNGEDRLLSKQSSNAPNVNAARAKFRTVAIIARSLGTFTPQHHISLKESTAKQTGMKYRLLYASPHPLQRISNYGDLMLLEWSELSDVHSRSIR